MTGPDERFRGSRLTLREQLPIVLLVLLSMGFATLPHTVVAVLSSSLISDLGLSRTQIGLVLTLFFLCGLASAQVVGKKADNGRGASVVMLVFPVISLSLGIIAFATSVFWIGLAMAVGGVGQALGNIGSAKVVAVSIERNEQALVWGIRQSGVSVSVVLVGSFPLIAGTIGWRWTVAIGALLPIAIIAVLWSNYARVRASADVIQPVAASSSHNGSALVAAAFVSSAGISSVLGFLPLYAQDVVRFTSVEAGMLMSFLGASAFVSRIAWGWIASKNGSLTSLYALNSLLSVVAILMLLLPHIGQPIVWISAFLAAASMMAWHVIGIFGAIRGSGSRAAGRAAASLLRGSLAGFAISPFIFGVIIDASDSYVLPWVGVACLFVAAAVLARQSQEQ